MIFARLEESEVGTAHAKAGRSFEVDPFATCAKSLISHQTCDESYLMKIFLGVIYACTVDPIDQIAQKRLQTMILVHPKSRTLQKPFLGRGP